MNKSEVIRQSLRQVTIYAAFQRAKVYSKSASEADKKGVKDTIWRVIDQLLLKYKLPVTSAQHVSNILWVSMEVNKRWAASLLDNEIPIGVVQKTFNLYLKLLWCLGDIHEPPHCPIDKVIINRLPYNKRRSWTKIKDIGDYEYLIYELEKLTDGQSLSAWELETYVKHR